ncbi:MAG: hypothetical protein ABL895_09825 [Cyclobacteriaceae bacterium]
MMNTHNRSGIVRILFLLLVTNSFIYAQEMVFKGNINMNGRNTRFISGTENNGTILLNVNKSEGADNFYLINSSNDVIQFYDIVSTPEKFYNVIHLTGKGEYFYVYTYYKGYYTPPNSDRLDLTYLQYLKFDRDGSLRPQFISLTGTNPYDQYMTTLSKNDTVYIVGVNKTKYTVSVNIITPSQEVIRKEFELGDKKRFRKFYREDYFPVKDIPENSFETFLHKNKVYIKDHELIFISDDDDGPVTNIAGNATASLDRNTTFITRLNLLTRKANVQELRHNYTVKADHNSFLYGTDLYSIRFTKDDYSISIADLHTLNEIRRFPQTEIENLIDWSKIIISENRTLTGDKLKSDFQRRVGNATPVIGLHYKKDPAIFFGLLGSDNRTEDGKLKIGYASNHDGSISSLGAIRYTSGNVGSTMQTNTLRTESILLNLPMYYVPAAIRINEKRIYGKIPFERLNFALSTSIRPTSTYDDLEQLTEKWKDKYESKAVFSFENDGAVFLAYLSVKEGTDDVYVIIEKHLRK